jgi:hypothetical protein
MITPKDYIEGLKKMRSGVWLILKENFIPHNSD